MRDCICFALIESEYDFDILHDKYYNRAMHLIIEHKVKEFYVSSSIMHNPAFDAFIAVMNEIKKEYGIDVIIFAKTYTELEKAKKHCKIDYGFEYEVYDFIDTVSACQFKFFPIND